MIQGGQERPVWEGEFEQRLQGIHLYVLTLSDVQYVVLSEKKNKLQNITVILFF